MAIKKKKLTYEQRLRLFLHSQIKSFQVLLGRVRTRPRERLISSLIWLYLRRRWPYKKRSWELQSLADGTVKRVKRPLRPWFPWSWILASERVLVSPLICVLVILGVRQLKPQPLVILVSWILIAGRIWWVCQNHTTKLFKWNIRTLHSALLLSLVIILWIIAEGSLIYLAIVFPLVVLGRLWHYTKGWNQDRLALKRKWNISLGMQGKKLAGSRVNTVNYSKSGIYELTISLPNGVLTTADVERAVGYIASTFSIRPDCVQIVRTSDDARPIVRLLPPKVLSRMKPWPGEPVDKDGRLIIGVMGDDTPAKLSLWSTIGAKILWFVGERGSGKSHAVHLVIAGSLRSGLVAADIIDAKGGVDLGIWKPYAHFFGTTIADARLAVARANRIHDERVRYLLENNVGDKFRVGLDGPLWLLVIEEAPEVLRDTQVADGIARLARLSRASGIDVLLVSQIAKIDIVGGREVTGNVNTRVVFACDRDTAQRAIDNRVIVDFSQMPQDTPGAALLVGESTNSALFCRWFEVDLSSITAKVSTAILDEPAKIAILPDLNQEQRAKIGSAEMTRKEVRTYVMQYMQEHPDMTSAELSTRFNVPASTVRTWRNRQTG